MRPSPFPAPPRASFAGPEWTPYARAAEAGRLANVPKDMLNVMGKFLAMGMALDDVVQRSSWNPAKQIRLEQLGNLSAGAPGDVAVLRVEKGTVGFVDSRGARLDGTTKLVCEMTVRDGKVVYDLNGLSRDRWDPSAPDVGPGDPRWDGLTPARGPARSPSR